MNDLYAIRLESLRKQIVQSYVLTLRTPADANGKRTCSLARHGSYDVRLIEPSDIPYSELNPFWIELYDHKEKVSLESYGGDDLAEAAAAAEAMIAFAKRSSVG